MVYFVTIATHFAVYQRIHGLEPDTRMTVQSRYTMWHAGDLALKKDSLMKNIFLRISITLSAALLFIVAPATADEVSAELQHVRDSVADAFAGVEPEHVFESPIDGWYEVRRGAVVAYISADGRYLLQGDMIDLDRQVNLSENSRNEARVEMMSSVPDEDLIVFTPDEIKYTVSVFTDVDCTYCRRLHSQMDEYLAEGIQGLVQHMRGEQQIVRSWVETQSSQQREVQALLETIAKALQTPPKE